MADDFVRPWWRNSLTLPKVYSPEWVAVIWSPMLKACPDLKAICRTGHFFHTWDNIDAHVDTCLRCQAFLIQKGLTDG